MKWRFIARIDEGETFFKTVIGWKYVQSRWHGFHFAIGFFGVFAFKLTRWDRHWFFETRKF